MASKLTLMRLAARIKRAEEELMLDAPSAPVDGEKVDIDGDEGNPDMPMDEEPAVNPFTAWSTEALAAAIKALTGISEFENDKAAQLAIEQMSSELKVRPVEVEEGKTASRKRADHPSFAPYSERMAERIYRAVDVERSEIDRMESLAETNQALRDLTDTLRELAEQSEGDYQSTYSHPELSLKAGLKHRTIGRDKSSMLIPLTMSIRVHFPQLPQGMNMVRTDGAELVYSTKIGDIAKDGKEFTYSVYKISDPQVLVQMSKGTRWDTGSLGWAQKNLAQSKFHYIVLQDGKPVVQTSGDFRIVTDINDNVLHGEEKENIVAMIQRKGNWGNLLKTGASKRGMLFPVTDALAQKYQCMSGDKNCQCGKQGCPSAKDCECGEDGCKDKNGVPCTPKSEKTSNSKKAIVMLPHPDEAKKYLDKKKEDEKKEKEGKDKDGKPCAPKKANTFSNPQKGEGHLPDTYQDVDQNDPKEIELTSATSKDDRKGDFNALLVNKSSSKRLLANLKLASVE